MGVELQTTGAQQRDYVMDVARDRILAIDSAIGDDVYVYQNFRGDVRAVTSTTSAIKDVRNYLPTGVAISYDSTDFPEMRYGYQGKEQQITGLQDFVNRAYDPYTGRATSFDPLRTAAGAYGNHSGLGWQDYPLVTPGSQTQSDPEGLLVVVDRPQRVASTLSSSILVKHPPREMTQYEKTLVNSASHSVYNVVKSNCLGGSSGKKRSFRDVYKKMHALSRVFVSDVGSVCAWANWGTIYQSYSEANREIVLNRRSLSMKVGQYSTGN